MELTDAPGRQRYEAREDERLVGWVDYRDQGETRLLLHAEVAPDVGGRGVGSEMVALVLDDLEARGQSFLPICSFIGSRVAARI
jgi:predicted GNAT family acetyltransferase